MNLVISTSKIRCADPPAHQDGIPVEPPKGVKQRCKTPMLCLWLVR